MCFYIHVVTAFGFASSRSSRCLPRHSREFTEPSSPSSSSTPVATSIPDLTTVSSLTSPCASPHVSRHPLSIPSLLAVSPPPWCPVVVVVRLRHRSSSRHHSRPSLIDPVVPSCSPRCCQSCMHLLSLRASLLRHRCHEPSLFLHCHLAAALVVSSVPKPSSPPRGSIFPVASHPPAAVHCRR